MKCIIVPSIATLSLVLGCGASQPPPTQEMADVQAATRSAAELGAQSEPKAQLHLKLAEDQVAQAKRAMEDDDNARAERLLVRAKSDAELAVALMHERDARETSNRADEQSDSQRSTNDSDGVTP